MTLKVKKLTNRAKFPQYQTEGAAGLDLYSIEDKILKAGKFSTISTGIVIEIPKGYEGQIRPRSGLAFNYGIGILNSPGTIDSDYRGEIKIILFNLSSEDFKVKKGMRIAQLIISKIYHCKVVTENKLSKTKRGIDGFGSTGM
ncbi:MAG: dUTP diphosphatase [bacterium]|nr:dUTP diphosphatase [bacterium]